METNNLLQDFTKYIETLCSKHVEIKHSKEKKHFIRLDNDEMLQEGKYIHYPVVTMEKLTASYSDQEDNTTKNRHVEMMFLDHISDTGNFNHIENTWSRMESIAEDFIMKIKSDRRSRKYPFLKNLKMTGIELDFVENVATLLWGVLLSFDIELPFSGCINGKFSD